jgi:hypothetical protein
METCFKRNVIAGAMLAALAGLPLVASAGTFSCPGPGCVSAENTGSSFSATLTPIQDNVANQSTITIAITNTSPNGTTDTNFNSFLTDFVLNAPTGTTDVDLVPDPTLTANGSFNKLGFGGVGGSPNPGGQFGDFDYGAGTGTGGINGNGAASEGIDVGETETFTFVLTGFDSLVQDDFLVQNDEGFFFVARFRGVGPTGQDSDHVGIIPIPAAAWLLGSGLIGLVGIARRKVVVAA